MAIRILPPDVVSRIAAGEVIERPASVVKELVENSIDAGATEVLVEVEDGGRRLIRVRDNGGGMPPEDLALAFRSHATSKLSHLFAPANGPDGAPRELLDIGTLGFRGEALASIASVAEVEALTREPSSDCAWRYRIRGTEETGTESPGEGPDAAAGPPGTCIDVRNLFFNTPARRKFLKSGAAELAHVTDVLVRLALGFPGVRIALTSAGRTLLDCPPVEGLRERLGAVIGRDRAAELLEVRETEAGAIRVRGFIAPPHRHRADARGQHFFVDGRWVRDRVLAHALAEAYAGYQIPGQRPLAYLFVDVPPGSVDVNVHPTKTEVRFLDSSAVHRATFDAVRKALAREAPGNASPGGEGARSSPDAVANRERVREATLDFLSSGPRPSPAPWQAAAPRPTAGGSGCAAGWSGGATSLPFSAPAPSPDAEPLPGRPVQLLRTYILVEDGDRLVLYDQHALHEKVLYERIVRDLRAGEVPRQKLLVPEVVELPLDLAPLIDEVGARLAALGFEVEPFGPRELAVQAVPAVLDRTGAAALVLEAARFIRDGAAADDAPPEEPGDPLRAETRRLAQLMACKAAVKAGMPLADEEIRALLAGAARAEDPRFCPHGRPTSIEIPRGELERRFLRK